MFLFCVKETDNPDLRDRGYIYWRLLSTDPKAAKEVVLAEKPLISEETDLLEPTLLDELICHIGTLASVYHKPPNAFVEGRQALKKNLPLRTGVDGSAMDDEENNHDLFSSNEQSTQQPVVISGNVGSLIDDFDILGPMPTTSQTTNIITQTQPRAPSAVPNLLDDELSSILGFDSNLSGVQTPQTQPITTMSMPVTQPAKSANLLDDLFGDLNLAGPTSSVSHSTTNTFVPPKEVWLSAQKGKGLEVSGTFARRNNQIVMDLDFTNRALQPMSDFALQLNRNSFGLTPAHPIQLATPLQPNQSVSTQLILNTNGPVMKSDPLTNIQVAIKNNIDVFYFACVVPIHVYFIPDNEIDKMTFVQNWQEIPESNEIKHQLQNTHGLSIDDLQNKLRANNIHTVTRTIIEQKEMLYQTMKLTNGIFVLVELKITPGNRTISVKLNTTNEIIFDLLFFLFSFH